MAFKTDILTVEQINSDTTITSILLGTIKATTDFLTLTNTQNAVDMDGTGTAILFNQYY